MSKAKYKYDGLFTVKRLKSMVQYSRRNPTKLIERFIVDDTLAAVEMLESDDNTISRSKTTRKELLFRIRDIGKHAIMHWEAWRRAEAETASAKLRVVNLLESRAVAEKHLNVVIDTKNVLKDTIDSLEFKVYNAEEKLHNTENARLNLLSECEVLQALADVRKIQMAALETMLVETMRLNGGFDDAGVIENMLKLTAADQVLPQACDLLDEGKDKDAD